MAYLSLFFDEIHSSIVITLYFIFSCTTDETLKQSLLQTNKNDEAINNSKMLNPFNVCL